MRLSFTPLSSRHSAEGGWRGTAKYWRHRTGVVRPKWAGRTAGAAAGAGNSVAASRA